MDTLYENICEVAGIAPVENNLSLEVFSEQHLMAAQSQAERLTAAITVFINELLQSGFVIDKVDRTLIDLLMARIDEKIGLQLDEVLHNKSFQDLESLWSSLYYLVGRMDLGAHQKLEILDIDKESIRDDMQNAQGIEESLLYRHIYVDEYDTPGGEPFSAVIADFEFDSKQQDISLLSSIAKVASLAHCPFIGNVGSGFFHKKTFGEVTIIEDIVAHMEGSEYIHWNGFRELEESRYVGLTLPKFLLRLPYGDDLPVNGFNYHEEISDEDNKGYLWGKASFAFGANLGESFKNFGWGVNIRGPESGGKVYPLPIHYENFGTGFVASIPTEILIPESRELELANLGFIPLCYYKNTDYACFFSANSAQKPKVFHDAKDSATSRINSRLPYIFLVSRIGHYLKVLQRENIGSNKSGNEIETQLNRWLQSLVTKMNNPSMEIAASHPLKEAKITMASKSDNPGYYSMSLYVLPHFQIEGMDVRLSLVSELPLDRKVV